MRAIKHVIGADVNQVNAVLSAGFSQQPRSQCIDGMGLFWFFFSAVDGRVCRRVDDNIRAVRSQRIRNGLRAVMSSSSRSKPTMRRSLWPGFSINREPNWPFAPVTKTVRMVEIYAGIIIR